MEGRDAPLYHFTTIHGLNGIALHDMLGLRSSPLSLTRDPRLPFSESLDVVLVLDQTKLGQNFSMAPLYGDSRKQWSHDPKDESEERISAPVMPAHRYILSVHVPERAARDMKEAYAGGLHLRDMHGVYSGDYRQRVAETAAYLVKYGIPVYVRDETDRNWNKHIGEPVEFAVRESLRDMRIWRAVKPELQEGRDAPLYHATSVGAAEAILSADTLEARTDQRVDGRTVWGVSLTRTPDFSEQWADVKFGNNQPIVTLVLDQASIARTNRMVPLDWFQTYNPEVVRAEIDAKTFGDSPYRRRQWPHMKDEEFVVGPIRNVGQRLLRIDWTPDAVQTVRKNPEKYPLLTARPMSVHPARPSINIVEATTPHVQKEVDPALLTASEYRDLVDPQHMSHPPEAYTFSVMNRATWQHEGRDHFPEPIRRMTINGIEFEFRLRKEDRAEMRMVKTTPEGEIVRDEQGMALYWNRDELIERLPLVRRYEYSIGVFTADDGYVGGSADEWGTMLIRVAEEYRGFGLGPIIGKMARSLEPGKPSGGFTPAGLNNFVRVHREMVRDYALSGMYSHLVKTGQLNAERAKQIIASANLSERPTRKINGDLDHTDPADWLLMVGGYGDFYLYDRKLRDIIDGGDRYDHWREKMIKGMVYVECGDRYGRIKAFGGDTPKVKSMMLWLAATFAAVSKVELVVEPDDMAFIDPEQIEIVGSEHVRAGYRATTVRMKKPAGFMVALGKMERRFREEFDQYGEFKDEVQTLSYKKYRP
jgi:hypothetical protein